MPWGGNIGATADVTVPFTRMVVVLPVVRFLDKLGAPFETYMSKAGISPSLLDTPEAPVPSYLASRFADIAARREGVEDLGLIVGNKVNVLTDLGSFSRHLQTTLTCGDYLRRGSHLLGMLTKGTRMWLSRDGEQLRFNIRQQGAGTHLGVDAELYPMIVTIATLRAMSGSQWQPDQIELPVWCNVGRGGREILQDAKIVPTDGLISFPVPESVLGTINPLNYELVPGDGAALRRPWSMQEEIATVVELLIADGQCRIELVAEAAGFSPRTLQRRLGELGTTFSEIVANRRVRMAVRLLCETDLPITEIAYALGYTDASNFTRAFRARAGCPPTAFRERNGSSVTRH